MENITVRFHKFLIISLPLPALQTSLLSTQEWGRQAEGRWMREICACFYSYPRVDTFEILGIL
jgi:hypothetical protein